MSDAALAHSVKALPLKLPTLVRHTDRIYQSVSEYEESELYESYEYIEYDPGPGFGRAHTMMRTKMVPRTELHLQNTYMEHTQSLSKIMERARAQEEAFIEAAIPGDELWFFETSLKFTGALFTAALDRLAAENAYWGGTLPESSIIPTVRHLVAISANAAEKLRTMCPYAQQFGTIERLGDALLALDIWLAAPASDLSVSRWALHRAFDAVALITA